MVKHCREPIYCCICRDPDHCAADCPLFWHRHPVTASDTPADRFPPPSHQLSQEPHPDLPSMPQSTPPYSAQSVLTPLLPAASVLPSSASSSASSSSASDASQPSLPSKPPQSPLPSLCSQQSTASAPSGDPLLLFTPMDISNSAPVKVPLPSYQSSSFLPASTTSSDIALAASHPPPLPSPRILTGISSRQSQSYSSPSPPPLPLQFTSQSTLAPASALKEVTRPAVKRVGHWHLQSVLLLNLPFALPLLPLR